MEIERKFLLPALPKIALKGSRLEIQQGYICFDKEREVRIRKMGRSYWLTYKRGSGLVRVEEEIAISKACFERLWEETGTQRLLKTRFKVKNGGVRLDIDLYRENLKGLIVAEAEFSSEEESHLYVAPSFFGREITNDTRFANRRLLESGLPGPPDTGISGYRIAVLPVIRKNGEPDRFVLVTSRSSGEWIIPRGKTKVTLFDHETAALECLEEAGLKGEVQPEAFFSGVGNGLLKIYRMDVSTILNEWKENSERKRQLVSWKELCRILGDKRLLKDLKLLL